MTAHLAKLVTSERNIRARCPGIVAAGPCQSRAPPPPFTTQCSRWCDGVRALGEDDLFQPCGPAEGSFADEPFLTLVLHINREFLHHAAEVMLLRDLYRDTMVMGHGTLNPAP